MRRARIAFIVLPIAAALSLTGCRAAVPVTPSPSTHAQSVSVKDPWIKATSGTMTAAFAEVENSGNTAITVTSATSDVSSEVELHESTQSSDGQQSMKQKEGGFPIPAGKALTLQPGGDHIMLMGLSKPIVAGQKVQLALTFSDGSTRSFWATAKDFAGAKESYSGQGDGD